MREVVCVTILCNLYGLGCSDSNHAHVPHLMHINLCIHANAHTHIHTRAFLCLVLQMRTRSAWVLPLVYAHVHTHVPASVLCCRCGPGQRGCSHFVHLHRCSCCCVVRGNGGNCTSGAWHIQLAHLPRVREELFLCRVCAQSWPEP